MRANMLRFDLGRQMGQAPCPGAVAVTFCDLVGRLDALASRDSQLRETKDLNSLRYIFKLLQSFGACHQAIRNRPSLVGSQNF
jgi:hypothetical protein